jgi:hypothetical protein
LLVKAKTLASTVSEPPPNSVPMLHPESLAARAVAAAWRSVGCRDASAVLTLMLVFLLISGPSYMIDQQPSKRKASALGGGLRVNS